MKSLLLFLFLACSSVLAFASDAVPPSQSESPAGVTKCATKTVWRAGHDGKVHLVKVKDCSISCSGGTTHTTCRDNETCYCSCASSGQPGCTCHPQGGYTGGAETESLLRPVKPIAPIEASVASAQ